MDRRRHQGGFTLIEVLITVAIIGILAGIAVGAYQRAIQRGRRNALIADGRTLLTAFLAYNSDKDEYPPCCTPPADALNTATLHPLVRDGYLKNGRSITAKLQGGALSDYDSPDIPSSNHDFYALMVHRKDSRLQVLVADTDEYPGAPGQSLNGVYLIRGTVITPVQNLSL